MNSFIIHPPESSVAFYIFNFPIHLYGLIITLAIFIGITGAYFLTKKIYSKEFADTFLDYSPIVIILSIIGARLFYIIGDFKFYFHNPSEILMINHGGLSIWGGIIAGITVIYLYSKKLKIDFLQNIDIFALFIPLCQAIGRWGNYFNQEAYGAPSDAFIKYYVDKFHRFEQYKDIEFYHPTFLYEMVLDLILFIILLIFFKKKPKSGTITALYLISYGIIRIIVESIRIDSVCYIFNIPIAIIISLITIIASLIFLIKLNK